jgi:hypothetical protein
MTDSFDRNDLEANSHDTIDLISTGKAPRGIYQLNSYLSKRVDVSVSALIVFRMFYLIYVLILVHFGIDFYLYYLVGDGSYGWSYFRLSYGGMYLLFFIFELETTKKLNERLKINEYQFNSYILLFCMFVFLLQGLRFATWPENILLIDYVGTFVLNPPEYFILFSMTYQMITVLKKISRKCSCDERINLKTYEQLNSRSDAMRNTTKFYTRLDTIHPILEFKLLVQIFVLVFYSLNIFILGSKMVSVVHSSLTVKLPCSTSLF